MYLCGFRFRKLFKSNWFAMLIAGFFKGQPDAAYPFRCDLKESIEKLESLTNKKVVGIIYDKTHTIELLTEKKDTNERE
jgi:hypothetical protein